MQFLHLSFHTWCCWWPLLEFEELFLEEELLEELLEVEFEEDEFLEEELLEVELEDDEELLNDGSKG